MFQYKKSWIFFLCLVVFNPVASWLTKNRYRNDLQNLIDMIKRRNTVVSDEDVLDIPESVEDLPEAEPIHPGHTLLQPSFGMLKSSVKYPHKDVDGTAVYGNLNNLGITYGKNNERLLYTGFRKANEILVKLLQALDKKPHKNLRKSTNNMVIIELDPLIKNIGNRDADYSVEIRNNNNAMEIFDESEASNEESYYQHTRRQRKPRHSKYRERISTQSSSDESDTSSASQSSDYEQNAGNPYTVYKDKYKQNWLWNHFMDGNHMNVNPYAPPFSSMGPSGAALFFGRKWWYFNQDDFKPLN